VPEWLFDEPSLPGEALRLYCVLERLAQRDGYAHPLRATLAKRLGWSVAKVSRMLTELVAVHALKVEHQHGDDNAQVGSRYYLAGPEPFPAEATPPLSDLRPPPSQICDPPPLRSATPIGEGTTSKKIDKDSPNGESGAVPKSAPLVGEIVPALNPGAVYVEACRLAGYDPLPSDVGRIGKAAKEARAQGKSDDLVRGTCERLAQRNLGAPMFGRVLAELERGSNGHGPLSGQRRPTHQDTFDILDAFVAEGRAS
jgi:hypothetical protein